jgi:hypothetical protein
VSRHRLIGCGHVDINEKIEGHMSAVLQRHADAHGVRREQLLAAIVARVLMDDLVDAVLDEK